MVTNNVFTAGKLKFMQVGNYVGFGKSVKPTVPRPTILGFDATFTRKHQSANSVICIGVGGSYLGLKLLSDTMRSFGMVQKMPIHFARNLEELNNLEYDESSLFVITSKSGRTEEIIECVDSLPEKANIVYQGAPVDHRGSVLEIPSHIGGRFSAWATLFPIAVVYGFSIAEKVFEHSLFSADSKELQMTASWLANRDYANSSNGSVGVCSMVYRLRFAQTAEYLQQLFMESLGKKEATNPPVVLGGYGPNLQHSIMQYIVAAKTKLSCELVIPQSKNHIDNSLLINAQAQAMSLRDHGRNPLIISMEDSVYGLIDLMTLYELRTVALAELLGVDPFDQPGVELGKTYARRLSGGDIESMEIMGLL